MHGARTLPPPVTTEVDRMAHYAYPPQSIYMLIGDRLESLLDGIDIDGSYQGDPLPAPVHVLALMTIFQYTEGLSDGETIRELYGRIDWRYALHLPLRFERIEPAALKRFRNCVRKCKAAQDSIKCLMLRLKEMDILPDCDWDPAHR
jgi:hypothetical protein